MTNARSAERSGCAGLRAGAGRDVSAWLHDAFACGGWSLMTPMTGRWLARASFALMLAAVALLLAGAGWRSLTLVAFAAIGVCAVVAGGYTGW